LKKFRFEFRNYESHICNIDDPGAGAPVGSPDTGAPAPSGDAPDPVVDPTAPPADPNAPPVDPAQADPADPLTAELEKLGKELGDGEQPPADPNAAIPQEFAQALTISPFVTNAQQMTQAIQAADEVWKVATGQLPARTMLEGFKAANPQGFDACISDLTQYIEQVTGKKFGGDAAPADPVEQLRAELAQKEQAQQEAVQQQQMQRAQVQASNVTFDFVKKALENTYFKGQEDYFARQVVAAMPNRDAAMRSILNGDMKPLEAAIKSVKSAEIARWKAYNENFVKKGKTLANSVPATKNTPRTAAPKGAEPKFRDPGFENETAAQFSKRHWDWSGSAN
jgi:hypothetical protein